MYSILKKIILNKNYNKEDLTKKLDFFFLKNRITNQEYSELIDLMKNNEE